MAETKVTGSEIASVPVNTRVFNTNTLLKGAKIQTGRMVVGATSGTDASTTITFPEAYTSKPIVICNYLGYSVYNSGWTETPSGDWGGMTFSAQSVTNTTFLARGRRNDGSTLNGDYYFSWIAIGQ